MGIFRIVFNDGKIYNFGGMGNGSDGHAAFEFLQKKLGKGAGRVSLQNLHIHVQQPALPDSGNRRGGCEVGPRVRARAITRKR